MASSRKSLPITAETKERSSVAKRVRGICRNVLSLARNDNVPIVIDDEGADPPALEGKTWHYVNARGDVIRFPIAYRRKYGKPIYVSSSRHITVGLLWLQAYELAPAEECFEAITDYAMEMKEGAQS